MKSVLKYAGALALSCLAIESAARTIGYSPNQLIKPYKRAPLQDIVSYRSFPVVQILTVIAGYMG
jgi:preprotein translocase subunit SecB